MAGMARDRTAVALLTALVLSSWCLTALSGSDGRGGGGRGGGEVFILDKFKRVVKSAGGEVRVVTGHRWKGDPNPMHVGFIHMEPSTLFIPQYIDANLILFVRRGKVKVGWIQKDEMVEKSLKRGDLNAIPAGSAFYLVNAGGESLELVCSIDTSESLGYASYQPFFIGGGHGNPTSVLAGFNPTTLSAALNITLEELGMIMRNQTDGPIVYISDEQADEPYNILASVTQLRQNELNGREVSGDDLNDDEEEDEEEESGEWTWRKLLDMIIGKEDGSRRGRKHKHTFNLYDRKPSFQNDYGWSIAVNEHDYSPLKRSDIGVYLVNLEPGTMLAPHLNPTATEYGIVLNGSGTIQVVFPNGTAAMNAEVHEGDAFWIPRYFPFCQIASGDAPLEFFGFTTSSRKNHPQFLAGRRSLLKSMRGPELAAAFSLTEKQLERLVRAQSESVILPYATRPHEEEEEGGEVHRVMEEESLLINRKMFA